MEGVLYIELEAWYKDFQPSRKRKSSSKAMNVVDVDVDFRFKGIDNFVDPLADDGPAAAAAPADGGGGGT